MFYGSCIRLRAIEREDLPHFVKWFNDPHVRRNLPLFVPLSLPQEEEWFKGILQRPVEEQPLVNENKQGDDWLPMGNAGFSTIRNTDRAAEIGISIGEKTFWDKGYGTEVMRLLMKFDFNKLNLNRIFLRFTKPTCAVCAPIKKPDSRWMDACVKIDLWLVNILMY